jgi:hypothetical protein
MMVVLVVFGLAALTTSLAAMRLTEKAGEWTGEFYSLEAKAEGIVSEIDKLLYDAEMESLGYIESGAYLDKDQTLFPDDVQAMIVNSYTNSIPSAASGDYLERVMDAAFFHIVITRLGEKIPGAVIAYNAGYLRSIIEDEGFAGASISMTVTEDNGEFSKNLDISIDLIVPGYSIEADGAIASATKAPYPMKRFRITSWREWQEYFDYSEQMQFTDLSD